ncbi:MAG: pyruvate carboxylase [Alkaliphilus sp.]
MHKFKRILVANRGEIAIRVFRACSEMGIRSVAIYSSEDKNSLFRTKADEAYLIGKDKGPVEAYLNIDEIIKMAKKKAVDAIHPGYGFLSENPEFASRCAEAGIVFIGPDASMMNALGDKVKSKIVARTVNVPVLAGEEKPISSDEEAIEFAESCGYPIILKAAAGGGGRGMRIVRNAEDLISEYRSARNEAIKAFGIANIFIEKYLEKPKHIEVQVLGDEYGNIVHLYERDCSIQRRYQKVIEFAPSLTLSESMRKAICDDAIKIAKAVNYKNAGTVEFLLDSTGQHYFIEMNTRVQVEHTITEMITGIDIVQSQILIAEGYALDSPEINIPSQESVAVRGYSIQCRVTTEDPMNNFAPDTGRIDVYRTGAGFGVRLDGGNGFVGASVSPYYDSLLVKAISWGRTFDDALAKAKRAVKEITIKGVKTNTAFLINVLNHPTFRKGECDTAFINENKELFDIRPKADVELHVLEYLGNKAVNETQDFKKEFDIPVVPKVKQTPDTVGTKQILDLEGTKGLINWIRNQEKLLLTDSTMRDAHQSLMATRMRTKDMVKIARATSVYGKDLFSLEMWGGATFDVAYRFLKESPWKRLEELRVRVPNILFQMLIRGSNAVGYKNYPDNVIRKFIQLSAKNGIDVFRIFDSLNWVKGMEISIDEVLKTGKVAEACICYTGDILDEYRDKYTLTYYVNMAKELEKAGTHILGIKDMSALLKPYAARKLVKALKNEISIPIHMHTHDTSGNGVATLLMAAEAGVDIVDTAFNSMSGLTSQPALNSVVEALKNTKRDTGINSGEIQKIDDYWSAVRPFYSQYELELKSTTTEIYKYEIPGGQYSNLKSQVDSFGLGHKFSEVKNMFKSVNDMFGDIVKVTPSSKAVGDMAIFMVQNNLTPENIHAKGRELAYPDSVVAFFEGMMGQPVGGFPKELQKIVLKDIKPITCRPGELLLDEDLEAIEVRLKDSFDIAPTEEDVISAAIYPKVFDDFMKHIKENVDLSNMNSDIFFHGLLVDEICEIEVETGKTLVVKLMEIGKMNEEGKRSVVFEINGNRRAVQIRDKAGETAIKDVFKQMADTNDLKEIGSSIPGTVVKIFVKVGDKVEENQTVAIIEAMKMETTISTSVGGSVELINVKEGDLVEAGELLIKLV